jgi:hypothetical protein
MKMNPYKLAAAGVLTAAGLTLAACGTSSSAAGICPKIGVLPDAADLPVTNSEGQVVALARLSVRNGPCIYDKTQAPRTGFSKVSFPLTVRVSAARFRGARVSDIDVTYIIATVSPDGVITGRQDFEMTVDLDGELGSEDDKVLINLPYEGNGAAGQHRVVAAFKVGRETVALNRQRLGR